MNIRPIIVTLFNSTNCGAYLQAFALGRYLERLCGNNVAYYDTGARAIKQNIRRDLRSSIRHLDPNYYLFERKRISKYKKLLASVDTISSQTSFEPNDLLVFGSDEIWNIQRAEISEYPALWGKSFKGGYRVAYAPSANGADLIKMDSPSLRFAASISSFKQLSARDSWTSSALEAISGRSARVVCDPTLLLSCDEYRALQTNCRSKDYLLVYSYGGAMTSENIKEIKGFAHAHGLKTVSSGTYLSWCDISLPSDPMEFLGLIDNARYVVTDTFHGSVFSYIYHKQFASIARKNDKVISFLRDAGLEDRNPYSAGNRGIESCLEKQVDFQKADENIDALRKVSTEFLESCVMGCACSCNHQ